MNIIKPKKLQKGDTIGFLSVSGCIKEIERIEKAKEYFENLGFKVVISDTTYKKYRYMAGNDNERLEALHSFFKNDNIDAILCTRGGFGVIRILKDIDYNLIKNNPKIIAGYSDITALLAIIHKKTGLLTFHSPMVNGDFGEEDVDEFTAVSFFSILQKENKTQIYKADENFKTYYQGTSRGILWGGNLSTIASLSGTDFIPDKRFNLFLEDLNEPAYKLDKMLTQLLNIDKFKKNLSGIIIGKFTGIDKENYLEELFKETAENLSIPTCNGFKISHDKQKYTLAIGIESEFNASTGTVTVDSYCVT